VKNEAQNEAQLPDIVVIQEKLLCCQVCSRLTAEETERRFNGSYCGTERGWQYDHERKDQGVQCAEFPNRKHYIFTC